MKNRVLQVGVAAALVFGVLAAFHFVDKGTTSVAWGEVAQRVGAAKDFVFKVHTKTNVSGQSVDAEMTVYQSQYGMRMDMYAQGRLQMTMFMSADQGEMVTLMYDAKQYMKIKMTPQYKEKWAASQQDPRGFVKWFTSSPYTSIGRSVIDGVEAEGIEVSGQDLGSGMFGKGEGRLWVDPVTQWPVRLEIKGTLAQGGTMEIEMYGFEWDKTLEASWYSPTIPADYTQQGTTMTMVMPSEETLIKGLRVFAELSGGRYPESLNIASISGELGKMLAIKYSAKDVDRNALTQTAMDISQAGGYFIQLVSEGKSPEYFGKDVTAADADKVLMRWKSGEGKMKVVYGDLSVEEVADVNDPAGR